MLVLVTSTVRLATNSISLHTYLFDRHNVSDRTGIPPEDLRRVSRQIQVYFSTEDSPLSIEIDVSGLRRHLFSEAEVLHMADVKGLFLITWRVQQISSLLVILFIGVSIARERAAAWRPIAVLAERGARLTIVTMVLVGGGCALAFGPLFSVFHRISFRNDLWILDARTDSLVQLFPLGFWRDVTLLIGIVTLLGACLLFLSAKVALRHWPSTPR